MTIDTNENYNTNDNNGNVKNAIIIKIIIMRYINNLVKLNNRATCILFTTNLTFYQVNSHFGIATKRFCYVVNFLKCLLL